MVAPNAQKSETWNLAVQNQRPVIPTPRKIQKIVFSWTEHHAHRLMATLHRQAILNRKPRRLGLKHASPGGFPMTARWFLENSRNTNNIRRNWTTCIHIAHNHSSKMKTRDAAPLTWISRSKSAFRVLRCFTNDLPFDLRPWALISTFWRSP